MKLKFSCLIALKILIPLANCLQKHLTLVDKILNHDESLWQNEFSSQLGCLLMNKLDAGVKYDKKSLCAVKF